MTTESLLICSLKPQSLQWFTASARMLTKYVSTALTLTIFALSSSQTLAAPEQKKPQQMQLQSDVLGQQVQPKVLFILPWEEGLQAQDIELDDSLISEEDFLSPVDRTGFQQEIKLYNQLNNMP